MKTAHAFLRCYSSERWSVFAVGRKVLMLVIGLTAAMDTNHTRQDPIAIQTP